jgi:hypothetical protein
MRFTALLAVLLVSACSRAPSGASPGPAESTGEPVPPKGTLALGAPISASPMVSLAEIARNPGAYSNRVVATTGKVTAVCQEMGCWMEIQDASGQAHVRMHGHSFFVPKTAAGHVARVQATVVPGKNEECDEQPTAAAATMAKVELDATGIELD